MQALIVWFLRRFEYVRWLEQVQKEHAELVMGDLTVEEFHVKNKTFSSEMSGKAVQNLAKWFATYFESIGAENYMEFKILTPTATYAVTCQKVGFRTPAQEARIAKNMAIELQQEIDELKEQLRERGSGNVQG